MCTKLPSFCFILKQLVARKFQTNQTEPPHNAVNIEIWNKETVEIKENKNARHSIEAQFLEICSNL